MMTFAEALSIYDAMYQASDLQDPGLALAEVHRDLMRMTLDKKAHPLIRVEAAEVLFLVACGPEGDTTWIPKEVRERALQEIKGCPSLINDSEPAIAAGQETEAI